MNTGKLSFENDPNGRRVIDVSELERVFGLDNSSSHTNAPSVEQELEKASSMLEMERLKMRIRMLEEQLDMTQNQVSDLKDQRDLWQKQASQVLITSQYSQKQAEDLREEMKEREKRARERRTQQELEQKVQKLKAQNENQDSDEAAAKAAEEEDASRFKGLWKRAKAKA